MAEEKTKRKEIKIKAGSTIVYILVIAIITSLAFTFVATEKIKTDYNKKLTNLKQNLESELTNLTAQINLLENLLDTAQKENKQKISTLTSLIEEIEEKSNIQLSELEQELKNIQIESADFSAIVDDVLQSVVSVRTDIGQGSGAIIGRNGFIVTNLHVINGASRIEIETYSGKKYSAGVIGADANADIAVLKINKEDLQYLELGNSDEVKIGDKVIALGNPAGLDFTVTEGIVSAKRQATNGLYYFQTDVSLNPGNSGGPLVDKKGEIVGINNFKMGGYEALGFALTSNDAEEAVDSIMSQANATYP